MINNKIKMADLVHQNYHVLPIINRFGINLGFGDKTIEQICTEKNINIDFFLEIVNVFINDDYFPKETLQNFEIIEILDYLKKTHKYFLEIKLVRIEKKINDLIDICCEENSSKIELIRNFYLEYKNELIEHIKYEDEIIFPYVYDLLNKKQKKQDFKIQNYLDNHSNIEEKIFDLKNLIIKYLPVSNQAEVSNEILYDLFDFEKDILNHQNIEEKVLVPKVMKLENDLS
ncbi:MAG: hemerythrin domain-containing protein [Bacteroidales bacterium]|nr:hemerythrin domain-containing protein [Bacteroidales bacterium]